MAIKRTRRRAWLKPELAPGFLLSLSLGLSLHFTSLGGEYRVSIQADKVLHELSPLLIGACLEDVNHEVYGGIYSQMIFGESFQEPPPSPVIAGFRAYGGGWKPEGEGAIAIEGTDGPKLVSDHSPITHGSVGVEVRFPEVGTGNAGLIVCVREPRIGADSFIGYEVSLDSDRQGLRLGRHQNNFQLIADAQCQVPLDKWIALQVNLSGSRIEILVDGKSVLTHDDQGAALGAGAVGLRSWHRNVSFRNLRVKEGEIVTQLPLKAAETMPEVSGMWRAVARGSARGHSALTAERPFAGRQSQQCSFESGQGEWGIENQGLNHAGMHFELGKVYEGYVWVRAAPATPFLVALEDRAGTTTFAEAALTVVSNDWQRLDFTLTPNPPGGPGRFVIKLKQPGSITLGHAFLQPGEWGRFKGLPVRRDIAEALVNQGLTVLRYGGSMVNHAGYKWKKMIGLRDRRPPYEGTWYPHSSNGWGIPDFMQFCESAGFESIPAFNMDETPADMADFIDYAKADVTTVWGAQRAADGHPAPYRLRYIELGNEERVDEVYAQKFQALARAIWAKDPGVVLVVGDFAYERKIHDPFKFEGAVSCITSLAAHQRILRFAKDQGGEVWFDVHVWTDTPARPNASLEGMFSFADALGVLAAGAKQKVVVFELNAGNHAHKRALASALALQAIERDGRIPVVTSANCLQPDGQNDNGWDQGLLFLNPSKVWLQPPGFLTQILRRNFAPKLVDCLVEPANDLDVNAKRSSDDSALIIQAVNVGTKPAVAELRLRGFQPRRASARVTELAGPLEASNTSESTRAIVPKETDWEHHYDGGVVTYSFPPHSITMIRVE